MHAILYQFQVSHYCEKARWALDYKGVAYRTRNLVVGLHFRKLRKLAADTTVPLLWIDGRAVQGSDRIIDYLDGVIAQRALTPASVDIEREARRWERYADKNIGEPLRLFFYHSLLEYPATLVAAFSSRGPWYGPAFYLFAFKRLRQRIRQAYRIDERTAQLSRRLVDKALGKLNEHLQTRRYLVGDTFTRADLSLAALLSPLVMPTRQYIPVGSLFPPELSAYREAHETSRVCEWVRQIYAQYRRDPGPISGATT